MINMFNVPSMILSMELNIINNILIKLQVLFINSKYELSSIFIFIKNHHMISTWGIYIIINHTCTADVHQHNHVFIMLYSTKIIDLTYIQRLHYIYFIITSFKLKSDMNLQKSSTYNIVYTHRSTHPYYIHGHIHFIS